MKNSPTGTDSNPRAWKAWLAMRAAPTSPVRGGIGLFERAVGGIQATDKA